MIRLIEKVFCYLLFLLLVNGILLSPVFADTQINLTKVLNTPANPIPSSQEFTYNLAWSCPGSVTPNDDCMNMQILEPLPLTIQATKLPNPDGKLSKVCVQNTGDPIPNLVTCTQPVVNANNPTDVGASLYFIFVNRVIAGDSGSLSLQTRFPAGTSVNGDTATNQATITGECDNVAVPACVNPAPETSTSTEITVIAEDKATINKTVLLNGAIDYNTIYRIEVCPTPNPANDTGYINPQNVVVTDTLPAGATFVSASPVASGVVGNIYTWDIADLNSCQNIDITVRYDAPANAINDSKTNDASFTYDPIDATPLPKTDSSTHILAGPNPGLSRTKGISDSIVNPTQTTVFNVRASNNGNLPLGIKITDPLPSFCQVQSFNVNQDEDATAYTITLRDGTIVNSAGAPASGAILATTIDANALVINGDKQIAHIEVEYGDAADPRIFPNARVRLDITCLVLDPDRDNIALVLPETQTNTATILGENGAEMTTANSSRNVIIRAPGDNFTFQPDATKTQVPVATIIPGNDVTFNIAMTNSSSYSSAPEQVALIGPVFSDLLPIDMTYVSSTLVGGAPAGCAMAPDIYNIADYNSTGRTLVVWSWGGKACSLARGDTITYDIVATVGAKTPGGTVQNNVTFMGSDNLITDTRGTEGCAIAGGDIANIVTTTNADYNPNAVARASTGTADEDSLCHAQSRSFSVQRITNLRSRKAVKGALDAAFLFNDGAPNIVGRTVHEGAVFWRLEINNTTNVPLDNIEIIDIIPFDGSTNPSGDSNSGIGTGVPLGSTWSPEFVSPIDLTGTPVGTKVYYTQVANPCRNNIVAVAGCNPMTTLADGVSLTDEATVPVAGAAGQWSTVLPNVPKRILAFRIVYPPAFAIQPGEILAFVNPMFIPLNSPVSDCVAAATDACSEIAWNTFGFSYEEADIGLPNSSAPTRVGIIVQPLTGGTAALGDFVWFDTDKDGVQDADEMSNGVNFVLVELFKDPDGIPNNGDEVLLTDTRTRNHPTNNLPGYYHFANLGPTGANDRYIVRFHPPAGYDVSPADSLGNGSNTANDSDGILTNIAGVDLYQVSGITLSLGQDRPDIDQGIFIDPPKFSLGNRVWMDPNNDSTDNDGAGDALESGTGIAGVQVELWSVDGAGDPINGAPDAFLTTNATGYYLFTNLDAGEYRLVIPATQLIGGQPLANLISSGTNVTTLAEFVPVPGNSDRDVLDHGGLLSAALGAIANGSVISSVVTLGPLVGEPVNEQGVKGQTQTPGYFDTTPNNRSNLSIDFGFLEAAGAPPPVPVPFLRGPPAENIPVLSNISLFIMALCLVLLAGYRKKIGLV